MARNGSGTYSKVNTFVAGNTITAAGHNENWDDLVTEMSNSVAADGQTSITGQLKGANGTKTAPSYSFATDLDTGMYRIGANNLGLSCGDTKILDITTTGASVTGTLASSGAHTITAGGLTVTAGNVAITAGDFAIATNKFTVANASGNTVVAGTLGVTGDVAVNTNKLTVTAASGNTSIAGTLAVTGNATFSGDVSAATISGAAIAAQSGQETGTSTTTLVTPGRQHFHQSAAKGWTYAGITGSSVVDYNVSTISDNGTGDMTVNWATDFSTANYCVGCSSIDTIAISNVRVFEALAAGATRVTNTAAANSVADPGGYFVQAFGDQA